MMFGLQRLAVRNGLLTFALGCVLVPTLALPLLLGVGSAHAQQGDAPSVSLTANQGSFSIGEILRLSLSIQGVAASQTVDEYIFVTLPTGELLFFDLTTFHLARADDPSTFVPAIRGLVIPPRTTLNSIVLELPFPDDDALSAGVFTWAVALTNAGATDIVANVVSSSITEINFIRDVPEPEAPPPPPLPGGIDVSGSYVISGGLSVEFQRSGGGSFLSGGRRPDQTVIEFGTFRPTESRMVLMQNGAQVTGRMVLFEEEPDIFVDVVDPSITGTISDTGDLTLNFAGTFTDQGNSDNTTTFAGSLRGPFEDGKLTLNGSWMLQRSARTFSVMMFGTRE